MNDVCLLGAIVLLAFACLAIGALLLIGSLTRLNRRPARREGPAVRRRPFLVLGAVGVLALSAGRSAAAETGMTRWFSCGIGFWRPCGPSSDPVAVSPTSEEEGADAESIAPEALRNWGTPVVGPSGALSYQLPPRPLLDLFQEPTDAHAREYLQWLSEKTRHREAAFAAIKRMATAVGYSVGPQPAHGSPAHGSPAHGSSGGGVTPELLMTGLLPDMGTGLTPEALVGAGKRMPLPQQPGTAPPRTPPRTELFEIASRAPETSQVHRPQTIGPRTRVLYFFAPHCPYCAQETPLLNALLRGRTDVVGIAMDTTPDALLAYVRTTRFAFPVTLDQGESQAFGITGYPAVVVREDTGAARKLTGLATTEQLQRFLQGATP
jgi:thiol-disulfide isomerase/thioredoxin